MKRRNYCSKTRMTLKNAATLCRSFWACCLTPARKVRPLRSSIALKRLRPVSYWALSRWVDCFWASRGFLITIRLFYSKPGAYVKNSSFQSASHRRRRHRDPEGELTRGSLSEGLAGGRLARLGGSEYAAIDKPRTTAD